MKKPVKLLNSLKEQLKQFPQSNFANIRKYDIHTGIDLYCKKNAKVKAIEEGVVVSIEIFTGSEINMPWWNTTYCIVIKGQSGYIVYGEVKVKKSLRVGDKVEQGQRIAKVLKVLKKKKTKNSPYMLHLELYSDLPHSIIWQLGHKKADNLLDPTALLLEVYNEKK